MARNMKINEYLATTLVLTLMEGIKSHMLKYSFKPQSKWQNIIDSKNNPLDYQAY